MAKIERSLPNNNKYTRLISNTLLFALGTFSSKILVFLLMPLYTRVLSSADYGIVDLIVQISNLMLPLATVGILNSVIRFGLDSKVEKSDVFTISLVVIGCGFAIFLLLEPIFSYISYFKGYTQLIYLYVLMSSLRSLCSQFVRAQQRVRLYAIDGVFSTMTVIIFNILYLVVFQLGITGYMLATICSDFCSVIFLTFTGRLWRYIKFHRDMAPLTTSMLRYAIPLIPTTIFWWITNVSSRYIITYMLGSEVNGLYAVSYKLPTMVVLVSNIFIDAWQMSAVADAQGNERSEFFSKVFGAFESIIFLSASGLILMCKLIMKLLVSPEFYPAWQYVPILVIATSFSCMVSFLGSVYMVEKRSVLALVTTMTGAVLNVILSFIFIPWFGANGAALAMFISYFVVFILRAISAQHMVHMSWNIPKMGVNLLVVCIQSVVMIFELPFWIVWELILTAIVLVLNLKPVVIQLRLLIGTRQKRD